MTPTTNPELVGELFAAFKGATALAHALSTPEKTVAVQTVHSWKRNGVPDWRREPIVRVALVKGVELPESVALYLDPHGAVKRQGIAPSAEDLADKGIASSAQHAEAVREGWGKDAYGYVERYAAVTPGKFLGEEIKQWAYDAGLDKPANEGAWGAVMRSANRNKVIKFVGFAKAKNATRHGSPSRVWRTA